MTGDIIGQHMVRWLTLLQKDPGFKSSLARAFCVKSECSPGTPASFHKQSMKVMGEVKRWTN